MMEAVAEWMELNPKGVGAMGAPMILFVGHTFLRNDLARVACGVVAACTMVAVTVMAVMTARWTDLIWPCFGFIAWSVMASISKSVDSG